MMFFWIAAALLGVGATALIVQRSAAAGRAPLADPTVAVYRRALAEIDEMAERGLILQDERLATRAEAGRRLIAAAADASGPVGPPTSPRRVLIAAAAIPLVAIGVYLAVGAPGYADQPFQARLAAWNANPERYREPELAAVLRSIAAERPGDPEPLRRLAALDLSLGDAAGAAHALRQAAALPGAGPEDRAALGEALVLAARGEVGPEALEIFRSVLKADPGSPTARYYLARARIAAGDRQGGLADWRALLGDIPPDDSRYAALAADIAAAETPGTTTASQPETGPAAGGPMSAQIQSMVDGLAARLAAHPDDPDGWVRLVRAYTVLGERERRDGALAAARRRYAANPAVLAALAQALQPQR
jgi:cytochrome c-type biogenesis protein CcmH